MNRFLMEKLANSFADYSDSINDEGEIEYKPDYKRRIPGWQGAASSSSYSVPTGILATAGTGYALDNSKLVGRLTGKLKYPTKIFLAAGTGLAVGSLAHAASQRKVIDEAYGLKDFSSKDKDYMKNHGTSFSNRHPGTLAALAATTTGIGAGAYATRKYNGIVNRFEELRAKDAASAGRITHRSMKNLYTRTIPTAVALGLVGSAITSKISDTERDKYLKFRKEMSEAQNS